jgi:tRNA-2-methylthio-N6-dimethylallyladenosine synthase
MPSVYLKTYGCQMNERDSEQVASMFRERGFTVTGDEKVADVILLNTCSVRDQAEQKALGKMGMLGRLRRDRPEIVYGFMGCMAQRLGEELLEKTPHLDLVVGTQKYHRVVDHVEEILRRREEMRMDDLGLPMAPIVDVGEEGESQNTIRDHEVAQGQATAFVSIMQGCNMKCSFCIVPTTRGEERARPIRDIVEECERLAGEGVREVTLLGQIVNLYGRTELERVGGKSPFVQLLEAVHGVGGIERIRFTSPHPVGYREDLVRAFAELPKLCSHIHLPLQSGSERILKAMRRPYKPGRFLEICGQMREARPDLAITTDVIVGFPGETDEDYEATRELCRQADFDNAFIFRYSPRRGTPAAEMPEGEQLPERVKEERNQDLLRLIGEMAEPKYAAHVGTRVEILCEGYSRYTEERLTGRTSQNRIVVFEGRRERHVGQLLEVRVVRHQKFTLFGEVV